MQRMPEPEPEPEPAQTASILARHVSVWLGDDAGEAKQAKACVAQLLGSAAAPQGAECERFVKRSAALIDNDRANPLLFIGTVKEEIATLSAMLLADEAGVWAAASTDEALRQAVSADDDLRWLVHVGVEFACVRPLLGRIMRVARQAREKEEAFLKTQVHKLKTKDISEYISVDAARTVAPRGMDPRAWVGVIETFNELQRPMLPSHVLRQLQRTVDGIRGVAEPEGAGKALAEQTVTQLLCFVVVQSSVQWLRSIHLVVTELSEPVVTTPGPTKALSPTWCYRVFSNALSVIEGMTVSLHIGVDSPGRMSAGSSGGGSPRQSAKKEKNSVWRHFTTASQDERHPNAPKWLSDAEVEKCTGCAQPFDLFHRRHHCRHCGNVLCEQCTAHRVSIPHLQYSKPVRVCSTCSESIKLIRNPPTDQPAAEAAIEQLLEAKGSQPGNAVRNYIGIFDERIRIPTPETAGVATREVMDAVRQMILDEHRASLLEKTLKQTEEEDETPWIREESLMRLINTILERRLFLPLRDALLNCLTQVHCKSRQSASIRCL